MHKLLYSLLLYDKFISTNKTNNMMKGEIIMKKTSKIIIALVTVLALGMIVAGCSCSNTDNKSNTTTSDTAKVAAADNTTRTTDNAPNNLIGSWKHEKASETDTNHIYTYNADGTGKITIVVDKEYSWHFTYTATNDTISRTMSDGTEDFKYSITGDNMDVTNTDGSIIHYTRVK